MTEKFRNIPKENDRKTKWMFIVYESAEEPGLRTAHGPYVPDDSPPDPSELGRVYLRPGSHEMAVRQAVRDRFGGTQIDIEDGNTVLINQDCHTNTVVTVIHTWPRFAPRGSRRGPTVAAVSESTGYDYRTVRRVMRWIGDPFEEE